MKIIFFSNNFSHLSILKQAFIPTFFVRPHPFFPCQNHYIRPVIFNMAFQFLEFDQIFCSLCDNSTLPSTSPINIFVNSIALTHQFTLIVQTFDVDVDSTDNGKRHETCYPAFTRWFCEKFMEIGQKLPTNGRKMTKMTANDLK